MQNERQELRIQVVQASYLSVKSEWWQTLACDFNIKGLVSQGINCEKEVCVSKEENVPVCRETDASRHKRKERKGNYLEYGKR